MQLVGLARKSLTRHQLLADFEPVHKIRMLI